MERESEARAWWVPDFQVSITHRVPEELWQLVGSTVTPSHCGEERPVRALPRRGPLLQGRLARVYRSFPSMTLVEHSHDSRIRAACQVWHRQCTSWPALKYPFSKEEDTSGDIHA